MRQLVTTILILMFGVASPSAAQVYPGKAVEVYDANDELVGQLIGAGTEWNSVWHVSVAADSGQAALVAFRQANQAGPDTWFTYEDFYFLSTDCTGTTYLPTGSDYWMLPSEGGNRYVADALGTLYRFSGSPSAVAISSRSNYGTATCEAASFSASMVDGADIGTLSTAFPFYVKEVPASAPLLPLWAFGTVAGGMVLSGGALAMRRRRLS
jgi:hypothetical protein